LRHRLARHYYDAGDHFASCLAKLRDAAVEPLRNAAYETVLRGCGFGALTIFCMLIGLAHDPLAMMRGGGILTTLMACVLYLKAHNAPTRDYRATEMWLYVKQDDRPPPAYAQLMVGAVLKEAYSRAAFFAVSFALGFWALAVLTVIARRFGLLLAPATG
jgi:hypothetical protein